MRDKLKDIALNFTQLPYLFVGAGISMRYSNTVSWNTLLRDIWQLINTNGTDNDYKKYLRKISEQVNVDFSKMSEEDRKYFLNPQIATDIQKQFNKLCLDDTEFEKALFTEDDINSILDNDYDYFKYYIAKILQDSRILVEKHEVQELQDLKNNQNKIGGIITTNYDTILEEIFDDFGVMVGQENLLTSHMESVFEIFKIHGSCNNPESIVITQEDYAEFEKKLTYLSAKMLTIFVEHPVIFLGYGIGDLNIRSILKEIAGGLTAKQLGKLKDNLIFITPIFEDGIEEEIKQKEIEFDGKSIKMTEILIKDFSDLYASLDVIKSTMPIKIMRKMQNMFCNFIYTTEPTQNIMVARIDDPNISDQQLGMYFGQISDVQSMGFEYYDIWEIIEDILFDNKPVLNNEMVFSKTFKLIRSTAGKTYLPIYKYLLSTGKRKEEIPNEWYIIDNLDIPSLMNSTEKNYAKVPSTYTVVEEIESDYAHHAPKMFAYILKHSGSIDVENLGDFLRRIFNNTEIRNQYASAFKKLVAVYDIRKYK